MRHYWEVGMSDYGGLLLILFVGGLFFIGWVIARRK